jgi:hypothetical protein
MRPSRWEASVGQTGAGTSSAICRQLVLRDAWPQITTLLAQQLGAQHYSAIQAGLGWPQSVRFVLARMERAGLVRQGQAGVHELADEKSGA